MYMCLSLCALPIHAASEVKYGIHCTVDDLQIMKAMEMQMSALPRCVFISALRALVSFAENQSCNCRQSSSDILDLSTKRNRV